MKIYVVTDSTDSWNGRVNAYKAFRTEDKAYTYLEKVHGVPLDLYKAYVNHGKWEQIDNDYPYMILEVELDG